jgi:hypothetical protein
VPTLEEISFKISLLNPMARGKSEVSWHPLIRRVFFFPIYLHVLPLAVNRWRASNDTAFIKVGE